MGDGYLSIVCSEEKCDEQANVWVDNGAFCTSHGVKRAEFLETHTVPIISMEEYLNLTDEDMAFFDPETMIIGEKSQDDMLTLADVETTQKLEVSSGLPIYREPVVMARCMFCEAVAIGHVNKVGGWLARHSHYHQFYSPEDDFVGMDA